MVDHDELLDMLTRLKLTAIRDQLEEFELAYRSKLETRELPAADKILSRLRELEQLRT